MRFSNIQKCSLLSGMVVILLCGGSVHAITFLDTSYGTPRAAALPRSLAMGGTGVAWLQGSQAVVNNPAVLAMYEPRFGVDLALGFWHAGEDRSIPLYDSFESFVRENTFAMNRNTYGDIQGGALWRVYEEIPMTVAVGIYDRFDFDYNYFEEIRDPSPFVDIRDQIVRTHEWDVDGRIRSVSFGYGSQIWGPTHLGVAVHRYFGSVSNVRRVVDLQNDRTQQQSLDRDFTGWGYSIGAQGAPNRHLDMAINWEGEFLVRGTTTITEEDTDTDTTSVASEEWVRYPGTLTFGFNYRPRSILRTTFSAEAVRRFWEDLDDSIVDRAVEAGDVLPLNLRDTWDLRVGLEHIFYNKMPLRFGFRFVENYADATSDRSIYSAGIGYAFSGWQVDVTGQYGSQTSRQEFLFGRSVTSSGDVFDPPESDARVDDTVVSLIVGVSRGF